MSTSPFSSSETEVPPPPASQWQKPASLTRRRQRKLAYKTLAILAVFVILVVGCTNLAPLSVQVIIETPTPVEQTPLQKNVSTPTPFPLPQATFTLGPTPPSARIIVFTPTSRPTSFPTANSLIAAIDSPTSTPTPPTTATGLPIATQTPTLTATTQSEIEHVVIITIDGMRPDGLDLADTPALDSLIANGVYSPNAQTVNPSFTLPAHVSMLSGVVPKKHGIVEALPCIGCRLTIGPTLFNVAHEAGLSTAMVFGKEKLNYLVLPNSVDRLFGSDVHDLEIKNQAIEFIQEEMPNVFLSTFRIRMG